jgi:hypothetical protein
VKGVFGKKFKKEGGMIMEHIDGLPVGQWPLSMTNRLLCGFHTHMDFI